MAITPLTAPYKTLTFDGETSASFGVQILGEGTFDAPKRDVEMISIPGRSGLFALDKGRFENIEVKYPAELIADSVEDFADAISDFRNFLCSRKGYCRLTDDYNPDEYRMAVYKSGLEADVKALRAGKFDIVFDCKPQRWLTSGETEVAVDSGDTLTNPTLFESSPLLEIEGTGDIEFNGYTVSIESSDIGNVTIPYTQSGGTFTLDLSQLNSGDVITVSGVKVASYRNYRNYATVHGFHIKTSSHIPSGWSYKLGKDASTVGVYVNLPDITLSKGTAYTSDTAVIDCSAAGVKTSDGTTITWTTQDNVTFSYDGTDTLTITYTRNDSLTPTARSVTRTIESITGYSTIPFDYGTIYCDTDIGEFYRIEGGEYISMNHVGDLGSKLPTLAPGTNTVTYDNTITDLKIKPRWWKV